MRTKRSILTIFNYGVLLSSLVHPLCSTALPFAQDDDAQTYMPAEHLPHIQTLMTFPTQASILDESLLVEMRNEIARVANTVSRFEPVRLHVRQSEMSAAKTFLGNSTVATGSFDVELRAQDIDQLWIRDYGPIFVKSRNNDDHTNPTEGAVDFHFNYWGEKYNFTAENERNFTKTVIPQDFPNTEIFEAGITTEGGAIEIDGEGTMLATESSIINDNRNPGKSKEQIEQELRKRLGIQKIIWMKGLKKYDLTDDHVDAFARFVRPGVVMISQPAANAPANVIERYNQALEILQNATDAKGRRLEVHPILEPDKEAVGIPTDVAPLIPVTTYVNLYLPTGAVVFPKFGDNNTDQMALKQYQELFYDREVVQLDLLYLPIVGGGIHCSTQQVPK